ncbi:hypothetical protein M5X02_32030, partial [Paenibacillus alvei]
MLKKMMEKEDLTEKLSGIRKKSYAVIDKKVSERRNEAAVEFERFFKELGFNVTSSSYVENNDGNSYTNVKHMSSYKNLQFTLDVPDAKLNFMGCFTVFGLFDEANRKKVNIMLRESGARLIGGVSCYSSSEDEVAKVEREINELKNSIEKESKRLEIIDN